MREWEGGWREKRSVAAPAALSLLLALSLRMKTGHDEHNFFHIFVLLFINYSYINNTTRVFSVRFADKVIRRTLEHKSTLSRRKAR